MNKYISILLLLLGGISCQIQADILIIDRIQQEKTIDMPARGLSMNQVLATYGEPKIKKTAIGEPPITEWKYETFSVYFEKSWVIDSVAYKASAAEIGPKPASNQAKF